MTASYTWSRLQGNVANEEDNECGNIGPRDLFLWGYLPNDRRHEMRASAAYQVTALALGRRALQLLLRLALQPPLLQPGHRAASTTTARASASTRAPTSTTPATTASCACPTASASTCSCGPTSSRSSASSLELYGDFLNVLALRTTTGVYTDDGPFFGQPSGRMEGMRIRLGLRFRY